MNATIFFLISLTFFPERSIVTAVYNPNEVVINNEFILVVDDGVNSKCLLWELKCDFNSVDLEDYRCFAHIQEQINKNIKIVHHLDFENLKKYNLKVPKKYPAVRCNRYRDYDYFHHMSFGSSLFPLLSLKAMIESDYEDILITQWKRKCYFIKYDAEMAYYNEITKYALSKGEEVEYEDFFTYIENNGKFSDFPKQKDPILPPSPSLMRYPWQEGYQLRPLFDFQYR